VSLALIVLSILSPLENAVRWLLARFHDNLGLPWAWAIVATTVVVRIALVPLTVKQIHSMQSLQKHAPEMKAIQQRHKGGDRQKMNEEMMAFYKENRINPAASCLPMLAQFPVFISLYLVLKHFSTGIAKGSDLSWLHFVPSITARADSHWSGFVLLAVYALSQISSSYFMSTTMDKMQRRLLMILPLVFISVIAHFQVGLVLYWVTTNLWTVGQGLVTRRLVPKAAPAAPAAGAAGTKRSSRTPPPAPAGNGAQATATARPKPTPPAGPRRVKRNKGRGR
jgi:YidC/Oxa1 family membrane protein insertase